MKPSKIKYLRRYNLGDYQHEEFEVEYVFDELAGDESAPKAFMKAREDVNKCSTAYIKWQKEQSKKNAKEATES